MESSKQYSRRTNSALSITDDQFKSELENEDKCLYDVYLAYNKAKVRREHRCKPRHGIDFWLAENEEEDHEFFIKKSTS